MTHEIDADVALITLEDFKTFAALTQSQDDERLCILINGVSQAMQQVMGRPLIYAEDIEQLINGRGKPYIDVRRWPIIAINSIVESVTTLTADTDYKHNGSMGRIYRVDGLYGGELMWPAGVQNITVDYDGGFVLGTPTGSNVELPHDITAACLKQTEHEWKRTKAKDWGESSTVYPDGTVTRNTENLLPSVLRVCKSYKRLRV